MIFIVWCICGIAAAGIFFPQFEESESESYRKNLGEALMFGLVGGPLSLIVSFLLSGFCEHGWRLWRK